MSTETLDNVKTTDTMSTYITTLNVTWYNISSLDHNTFIAIIC